MYFTAWNLTHHRWEKLNDKRNKAKRFSEGHSPAEILGSNPTGAWIFVCCECRVLSGRGLCDELITHPEESYRLCCIVVCDLETSRMGAPYIYIYDISRLRVKNCCRNYTVCVWWHQRSILTNLTLFMRDVMYSACKSTRIYTQSTTWDIIFKVYM